MINTLRVHRLAHPFERAVDEYWTLYKEAFPIPSERETKKRIRTILKSPSCRAKDLYQDTLLLLAYLRNNPTSGNMADYVQNRSMAFGIQWYCFTERKQRVKGIGRFIHDKAMESLRETAKKQGRKGLDVIVCEINYPERMNPEDTELDSEAMDPYERLKVWHGLGYRAVDPAKFNYVQPALTKNHKPYDGLLFCVRPVDKPFSTRIPADYLKQLLWLHTWAGFENIPGSDISGFRNPETDPTYKEMARQLHGLRSLPLVPLDKFSE